MILWFCESMISTQNLVLHPRRCLYAVQLSCQISKFRGRSTVCASVPTSAGAGTRRQRPEKEHRTGAALPQHSQQIPTFEGTPASRDSKAATGRAVCGGHSYNKQWETLRIWIACQSTWFITCPGTAKDIIGM